LNHRLHLRSIVPWRGHWSAGVLVAATAIALLACSGTTASGSPSAGASTAPSAAPSQAPSEAPSEAPSVAPSAAAVQDLAITGTDFAFQAPTSIPAGLTKVTLTNAGKEEHQAQVAKLADGKTLADLTAALQGDEAAALAMVELSGGPTGVQPGAARSTTANLEPGAYVFLCFVQSADGIPHLAKGMIAPIQVTEPAVTAEVPAGDTALTLQDFAFVGLDTLSTGPHTVSVTNAGPQPHEATIVKLADGVAATDLVAMFQSTAAPTGPPPFTTAGGVAGVAVGETITMDVDLPAGNYAFLCFVPDPASGAPHAALGMIGALTIE
jgi:plastocyanin